MVFPLGMYTTATFQLSRATHFEFLARIPEIFIFVALAAWLIAFIGLVRHLASSLRVRPPLASQPRPG
jgi:tellurite resistance protein TehA-like permease